MPESRKRTNSSNDQGGSYKRRKALSGGPPTRIASPTRGAQQHSAEPATRRRSMRFLPKQTPPRPLSTSPIPQRQSDHSVPPPCSNAKDFYVYRFLGALYSSYTAPQTGTPGPVEHFTCVSYPGDDDRFYELDASHVMPRNIVEEHNLYDAALQQLEESEHGYLPASRPDPVPPAEDNQQEGLTTHTSVCDDNLGRPLERTEDVEQTPGHLENCDPLTESWEERLADGEDDADKGDDIPQAWVHKGGRPPKAFIKKAAAIADAYLNAVRDLMSTFGVTQKVVYMATDLQPRKIETRETSSWNAHQRVYKIEHPKLPGESVAEFKTRQRLDYRLHIKPLSKDEKTEYRNQCEQTVMEYFFSGQGKELKASSPAKRVDAACKALQKLAQMISRADCEIQSFGGVNYIGPDKAGRASGGAIFLSSDTVMKAIKMFNIKTSSIMVSTGDFLQAVVAQEEMIHAQGIGNSVGHAEKSTKNRPGERNRLHTEKGTHLSPAELEDEAPHVAEFNMSDFRKKDKVNPGRTTIDWINLLRNAIRGKYRLTNCILSPHPGEPGFAVGKVPQKIWQEIGKMLTPEDFHPVTGGCHPDAPRFVPWTDDEKKLGKETQEYAAVALVVDRGGKPLVTVEQAEQLTQGKSIRPQAESVDDDENEHELQEAQNVEEASGFAGSRNDAAHIATPPLGTAARANPQPATSRKQAPCAASHFHRPTSIPDGTAVTTTSSRIRPLSRELRPVQHKKFVFKPPPARTPSVASTLSSASVTQAFSVNANQNQEAPLNRKFDFPKPKPATPQAGPLHMAANFAKSRQDAKKGADLARTSSRKPAGV